MNKRINITASSLGSYFGVGFNTPEEQLEIDLGKMENIIDEESQDRMNLGNAMEEGCLNYFEGKLNVTITNRNTEILEDFDGLLRGKLLS